MTYTDYALCYKALGDETRAKIFDMLKGGKLCACKILEEFNCTQPTLSYHMKIMVECSLVNCEKDGKWCYYSINEEILTEIARFVSKPICTFGDCTCEKD